MMIKWHIYLVTWNDEGSASIYSVISCSSEYTEEL